MAAKLGGTVVAAALALTLTSAPLAAVAQVDGPEVIDPFDGGEVSVSSADIAGSIRRLEPRIRVLEIPEPRSLRTEADEGDRTTVTVSSDVLFAFDSAELSPRAEATVRDIADDLRGATGTVHVVGHTDSVGTAEYNQDLSERRAAAVAAVLAEELGGDIDLVTEGRGFREPVAEETDDDPGAAARNRRVEIAFDR